MRRLVFVVSLVLVAASACGTTGRELPAPTFTTLPPVTTAAPAIRSEGVGSFSLTSPDFTPGRALPATAGEITGNTSPALQWRAVPTNAVELALVATDASKASIYWIVTGIPPKDATVAAGASPAGATVLPNSRGQARWTGPTAGSNVKVQVVFTIYAFDHDVAVPTGSGAAKDLEVINASGFTRATVSGWFLGPGAALDGG